MKNITFKCSLLYCFLCLPFTFTEFIPNELQFIIKVFLIILIISDTQVFKKIGKKEFHVIFFLIAYFFCISLLNPNYFLYVILVIPDFIVLYILFVELEKNSTLCNHYYNFCICFSVFVGVIIIIGWLMFKYIPSLSVSRMVGDYPSLYNPFVGRTNATQLRPCWYFAEPSYSGFFLGMSFYFLLRHHFLNAKNKIAALVIVGIGLLATASLGALIYILIAFPFVLLNNSHHKKLISFLVLFVVFIIYKISSSFDVYSIEQGIFELESHLPEGRQLRMEYAETLIRNRAYINDLFGSGLECVTLKFGEGISDAYHKLYCEWGAVFMFPFLFYVWKLTYKNLPAFVFIFFSFFSIIIHLSPIIVIYYYFIYYQEIKEVQLKGV